VQRSHICTKTRKKDLETITTEPRRLRATAESFTAASSGAIPVYQPPRNRTTATADTRYICAYSARKKIAKRIPEYSVWNPDTSSDSASGRSNGARLHSASCAMNEITNAIQTNGLRNRNQFVIQPSCAST